MHAQKGAIMPFVTVGMLALFGLAALGLDAGVVFWDKARLQNAADAAALSAAKVLDETKNPVAASDAGLATFTLNATADGNAALAKAVGEGLAPTFQYSETLNPFVQGAEVGPYVRASLAGFRRVGWFSQIFGVDEFDVDATAVAGPSPALTEVCDIAPVMVCAEDPAPPGTIYGYEIHQEVTLKLAANNDSGSATPGNYFLVRLGAAGGSVVRDAFAGIYESCTNTNGQIDTEPGNEVGPVRAGVDTRFEPCRAPIDCDQDDNGDHDVLPDTVTATDIDYLTYVSRLGNPAQQEYPDGEPFRRVLKVPVGDCSGMGPGATSVPLLDIVCFFLLAPVPPGGTDAELRGEFLGDEGCSAKGNVGPDPGSGPGPYKIQLYKDPDGRVS